LFEGEALDRILKDVRTESLVGLAASIVMNVGWSACSFHGTRLNDTSIYALNPMPVLGDHFTAAMSVFYRLDTRDAKQREAIEISRARRNVVFRRNEHPSEWWPMRVVVVGLVQEEQGSVRRGNAVAAEMFAKSLGVELKKTNETDFNRTAVYTVGDGTGSYDGWNLGFTEKTEGTNAGSRLTFWPQGQARPAATLSGSTGNFHLDVGTGSAGVTIFLKSVGGAVPRERRTGDKEENWRRMELHYTHRASTDPETNQTRGAASSCYQRDRKTPSELTGPVEQVMFQLASELAYAPVSSGFVNLDAAGPLVLFVQSAFGKYAGEPLDFISELLWLVALLGASDVRPANTVAGLVVDAAVTDPNRLDCVWERGLNSVEALLSIVKGTLQQKDEDGSLLYGVGGGDVLRPDRVLRGIARLGAGLLRLPGADSPLSMASKSSEYPELERNLPTLLLHQQPRAKAPPVLIDEIPHAWWERFRTRLDELRQRAEEFWFDEKSHKESLSRWDLLGFGPRATADFNETVARAFLGRYIGRVKQNSELLEEFVSSYLAAAGGTTAGAGSLVLGLKILGCLALDLLDVVIAFR
jgi:hypothetical protein